MKTKHLFLVLLTFFATSLFAQSSKVTTAAKAKFCINAALRYQQLPKAKQKGTEIQQRLVSFRTLYSNVLDDSFRFSYSGMRTSRFNYNKEEPLYDFTYGLQYFPDPALYFDQNPLDMPADSIITVFDAGQPSSNLLKAYYRVDDKIDSSYEVADLGQNITTIKTFNSFTSQGNIKQQTNLEPNDTIGLIRFTYNANGTVLVSDSMYGSFGMPTSIFAFTTYQHNVLGLLDTVLFYANNTFNNTATLDARLVFFYDIQQRINRIVYYEYNYYNQNQTINVKVDDSFGYTGNSGIYTYLSEKTTDYLGNVWEPFRIIKTLSVNGLTDTFRKITFGFATDTMLYKFAYNDFNNPDSIVGWYNQLGALKNYKFYYESFEDNPPPPNAIAHISNEKTLSLYPNPAMGELNILWSVENTPVKLSIYNVLGAEIRNIEMILKSGNNRLVVTNLPKGQYILRARTNKNLYYKAKFLKE